MEIEREYQKSKTIFSGRFCYKPHPQEPFVSWCYLDIVQGAHFLYIFATEMRSNPGLSVTNGAEYIATQAVGMFLDFSVDPTKIRYIECYPPSTGSAEYDLVEFTWKKQDDNMHLPRYQATNPKWTRLSLEELNKLLDQEYLSI